MKKIFDGFLMAWGSFCWIPCPIRKWDENNKRWMVGIMPTIGLLIGLLQFCIFSIMDLLRYEGFLGIGVFLPAALLTVIPFFLTGFIHLDGFMDTTDALMSRRSIEEKQRIMKDSNVGAFSVIALVFIMLIYFGSMGNIITSMHQWECMYAMIGVPFFARIPASSGILKDEIIVSSQYKPIEDVESQARENRDITMKAGFIFVIITAVFLWCSYILFVDFVFCIIGAAAAVAGSCIARSVGRNSLGGMSGDIAGYAITWGEVAGVAVLAFFC